MLNTPYDPHAVGLSFASLVAWRSAHGRRPPSGINPFRDYFSSHPPPEIREARFRERAETWWRRHPEERRALGEENLRLRSMMP